MKIILSLNYKTVWGQAVYVCGSAKELGNGDESKAVEMQCIAPNKWELNLEVKDADVLEYCYLIKDHGNTVHKEWGKMRSLILDQEKSFDVTDKWHDTPPQNFLYTSGFVDSFFYHQSDAKISYFKKTILLQVVCPYVKKGQELILCGADKHLGEWSIDKALRFIPMGEGKWQLPIDAAKVKSQQEYKLAIYDTADKKVIHWEDYLNRRLNPMSTKTKGDCVQVESIIYNHNWLNWKTAGVAIPVFSLRTNDSFGIGEFSDLKKMVDWAAMTNQKIIQILPINDTTVTGKWTDSYPYNAISIYALHPIYLGLKEYPLADKKAFEKYSKDAQALNKLTVVDYEKVLSLKWNYLKDLFAERGKETLTSQAYNDFFTVNKSWLFPYACFSYLRDKYLTADYRKWQTHTVYDHASLDKLIASDKDALQGVELLMFTQYLLHHQLVGVKEYAHQHNVILKGDIPIGISRDSVEAWTEPHLFNLDVQTGAPPDDFSVTGQNWGFPTYNWNEMSKDGYQWWAKRFHKMSDYFDAYRIDHILGFFRIWEIPSTSVQGLLGYFSPALPLSVGEIQWGGMWFDDYRMTNPYIHDSYLYDFFGEYKQEVIDNYLHPIAWQLFELNEECNTQQKIKALLDGKTDEKSMRIRDGLYGLCNEVLFVPDKQEPTKFHPRITAQFTYSYKHLDEAAKAAFNRLYDDFFYSRHSQYWREEAMKKLPTLISSTSMLVCGEDLGMIPACVPSAMNELQILSLEIERMPKAQNVLFGKVFEAPYMSVCTTSTHDMPPIRTWWEEDQGTTQRYYNEILGRWGAAPHECTPEVCNQIVNNHLYSPAMLVILPLQDWLSINGDIRRPEHSEERINIPAIAQHYWQYRMHISLEELLKAEEFNKQVKSIVNSTERAY